MNVFHCIIATERRKAPRELAWEANADLVAETSKGVFKVTPMPAQLHCMGEKITADPNVLTAIEWDQVSPYVVVHRGLITDFKVQLAGWPMIDKATWEKENGQNIL
jgi:hypothetical protein